MTCWAENRERLSGEEAKEDAADHARHQRLHGRHVVLGGVAQQTTEGDDRRQAGKVDEKVGGQTLQGQRILNKFTNQFQFWNFEKQACLQTSA